MPCKGKIPREKGFLWGTITTENGACMNALTFLLDNIFIRFGTKLYRQVVGIPMGTNCAPLVADLFLFCYERDFMMSLSDDKQATAIDAFNTTSRYLDDILNINNVCLCHIRIQVSHTFYPYGTPIVFLHIAIYLFLIEISRKSQF